MNEALLSTPINPLGTGEPDLFEFRNRGQRIQLDGVFRHCRDARGRLRPQRVELVVSPPP